MKLVRVRMSAHGRKYNITCSVLTVWQRYSVLTLKMAMTNPLDRYTDGQIKITSSCQS